MIEVKMSGDFHYQDFAADRIESRRKIDSAIFWLAERGYRKIKRIAGTLVVESRQGGRVWIETERTY